ncbi:hypothetical protein MHYP_G00040930 [Metynnis hypsauchen]
MPHQTVLFWDEALWAFATGSAALRPDYYTEAPTTASARDDIGYDLARGEVRQSSVTVHYSEEGDSKNSLLGGQTLGVTEV